MASFVGYAVPVYDENTKKLLKKEKEEHAEQMKKDRLKKDERNKRREAKASSEEEKPADTEIDMFSKNEKIDIMCDFLTQKLEYMREFSLNVERVNNEVCADVGDSLGTHIKK